MGFLKKANFVNRKRVICEVLREMYDRVHELPSCTQKAELISLLEEANTMAKKMNDKLYEYAYNVTENSEENQNYDKSLAIREGRDVHTE